MPAIVAGQTDTTPPELMSISEWHGSTGTWVLYINERLNMDSTPAKEAFLFQIGGVDWELGGVRVGTYGPFSDNRGRSLELTPSPKPTPTQVRQVWRLVYTPPSENPLKDLAGNLMEAFDTSWGNPPGDGGGGPPPAPDPEPPPPPLTANVSVPSSPETGRPATFDGSGSVGAESYRWDFGDGTVIPHPGAEAMPSHTYVEPGSYEVRLEVAAGGDCGETWCRFDEATATVEVEAGALPAASFDLDADCGSDLCVVWTGVEVALRDRSSGTVATRSWDYGDGEASSEREPIHSWSTPGFYRVTLTASGLGESSTASRDILVRASDPAGSCGPDGETLCLADSRYEVRAVWWAADGRSGAAKVAHAGTNDSGLFWFFDHENWELLVKLLDGCAMNDHVWVYSASTTDLGYVIRVTDTVTGTVRDYRNEPGTPAAAITDARAFPDTCRP